MAGELLWRHPVSCSLVWFRALKITLVSVPHRGWTLQAERGSEERGGGLLRVKDILMVSSVRGTITYFHQYDPICQIVKTDRAPEK